MTPIEYTVIRSARRRTAAIKINHGVTEVRVPTWVSDGWVRDWVESRRSWIEKNQQRLQDELSSSCLKIEQGGVLPYRGGLLYVFWKIGGRAEVNKQGEQLLITLSSRSKKSELEQVKGLLQRWYKTAAEVYLQERVVLWSDVMGLYPNSMKIKGYRRRWGSCSSERDVSFNWRLIFADEALVDYVVIHELAHIQHMNHSADFWAVVLEYSPQFKALKKELHSKSGWLLW